MSPTPDLFEAPSASTRRTATTPDARRRRLHAGHFAFMRALVQGLDWQQSWQRYLRLEGEASDRRTVRTTIAWLRDEFAAAARREQRFGTARLVLLDASRVVDGGEALPSLEDYAASEGLDDFSQAEQIASYEARYGRATRRQRRRGRLIARQLEALHWLELRAAEPPRAADPLGYWLNPALAAPLEADGIATLADLAARINGLGPRWHRGVRGIGDTKARRIGDWLVAHQPSTGLVLGGHARGGARRLEPAVRGALVAPATDVRPWDKFIVPPALDGRAGRHRAPRAGCLIDADDDRAAIEAWLKSKAAGAGGRATAHTARACRKEAERFLLWLILERRTALSSIEPDDCKAYRAFLADPQPRARWCAPRGRPRWSPLWRPFEGPLAPTAQRQATVLLKNLHAFLADRRYLIGNPWVMALSPTEHPTRAPDAPAAAATPAAPAATAAPATPAAPAARRLDATRSLDARQWASVMAVAAAGDTTPMPSVQRRLLIALRLLQATGLRPAEAVAATVDDLQRVPLPAQPGDSAPAQAWQLRVRGRRERTLALPEAFVAELCAYLASRGLAADPLHPDNRGAYLLGRASDLAARAPNLPAGAVAMHAHDGITVETLYRQLKRCFATAAAALRADGDGPRADRLARASTHWLRHSHAQQGLAMGLPLPWLQQQLGHAALATTASYDADAARQAWRFAEAAWRQAADWRESSTRSDPSGEPR
ncbi:phage integrase family protein [Aquabacterium humicola]|uniref:phage integrase family protein n=1 Tax=Aquabacterium humicola TaxID=3237377 RepID=UPI0025434CB0|nr:phage integrase family protein [Rubrivivax pictus]